MRKRKVIKIDDREITIKEMTIKEIMGLASGFTEMESTNLDDFKKQIDKILPMVTDISLDDIIGMAPSEANEIYEAVKEVNAVFFEMAEKIGLLKIVNGLKNSVISDFSGIAAS